VLLGLQRHQECAISGWIQKLLALLKLLPPDDATAIVGRLKKSEKLASSVRRMRGRLFQQQQQLPKPQTEAF
jgi:hypothetical protein